MVMRVHLHLHVDTETVGMVTGRIYPECFRIPSFHDGVT